MTQQRPAGTPSPRRIVDRREWQNALKAGDHLLRPGWAHAAMSLLMWMDKEGACYPGQDTLAAAMGKSSRAVRDDLAWLEHVGWVNVLTGGRRGDKGVSSRYQSTLPTGTQVPTGDAESGIQTAGFSASHTGPNRNPGTPQPEPTDTPTGTRVPGNSQKNSRRELPVVPPHRPQGLPQTAARVTPCRFLRAGRRWRRRKQIQTCRSRRLRRCNPRRPNRQKVQGPAMRQVGPSARPWAVCLHAGMMRVYLRTVPWVWLTTTAAGLLTWQATSGRAEDWASLPGPVLAGQTGYVPQLSPSGEVLK